MLLSIFSLRTVPREENANAKYKFRSCLLVHSSQQLSDLRPDLQQSIINLLRHPSPSARVPISWQSTKTSEKANFLFDAAMASVKFSSGSKVPRRLSESLEIV